MPHHDLPPADTARSLRLTGELTIYTAADSRQSLLAQLAEHPAEEPCTLDLSEVTELDTAGLQILLALRRTAPTLTLNASSPAVDRCLRLCGLGSLLPGGEV